MLGIIGPQNMYGRYAGAEDPRSLVVNVSGNEGMTYPVVNEIGQEGPFDTLTINFGSNLQLGDDLAEDQDDESRSQTERVIHFTQIENINGEEASTKNGLRMTLALAAGLAVMYGLFNGYENIHIANPRDKAFKDFITIYQEAIRQLPGAEGLTLHVNDYTVDEQADLDEAEQRISESPLEAKYILLSGGPDSATVATLKKKEAIMTNYNEYDGSKPKIQVRALYVNFGAPYAQTELEAAEKASASIQLPLSVLEVTDLSKIFTGKGELGYPIFREFLPVTIIAAALYARRNGASELVHGQIKEDEEDIPGTNMFMKLMMMALNRLFEKDNFRINMPFAAHSKTVVFEIAQELGVDLQETTSCLSGQNGEPCGQCRACRRRQDALEQSGYL